MPPRAAPRVSSSSSSTAKRSVIAVGSQSRADALAAQHPNLTFVYVPPEKQESKRLRKAECSVCKSADVTLRCGGCRQVKYCSTACAKKHWGEGGHAEVCKAKE